MINLEQVVIDIDSDEIGVKRDVVFNGHFNLEKLTVTENGKQYYRDICITKDAVFVLPFDPKLKKVVLLCEKRFGLITRKSSIKTWSSISGTIDKDVSPEEIAAMELDEEAGLLLKDGALRKIATHYSSPGIISEKKYIYTFEFDSTKFNEGVYGLDSENEYIEAKLFDYDIADKMVNNFEISDLNAIFALEIIKKNN
jgi:ADP-ribose pyrophosphatase